MKTIFICLFMLSMIFSDCSSSAKLTTSKAQNAIDVWVKGTGSTGGAVTVAGIQEIPQQNIAKADLIYSDFQFLSRERNMFGAPVQVEKNYSGPGVATFTHYNDGRWVLTQVSTSQGLKSTMWDKLNIEAH